jgi:hypothetical protein
MCYSYCFIVKYKKGSTRLTAASDKVYQLLAHGQWFSPASSTTKTGRHDITEILLKVALKHQKSINHLNVSYISTIPIAHLYLIQFYLKKVSYTHMHTKYIEYF